MCKRPCVINYSWKQVNGHPTEQKNSNGVKGGKLFCFQDNQFSPNFHDCKKKWVNILGEFSLFAKTPSQCSQSPSGFTLPSLGHETRCKIRPFKTFQTEANICNGRISPIVLSLKIFKYISLATFQKHSDQSSYLMHHRNTSGFQGDYQEA